MPIGTKLLRVVGWLLVAGGMGLAVLVLSGAADSWLEEMIPAMRHGEPQTKAVATLDLSFINRWLSRRRG